nr:uncharacterized protein LOC113844796 [Anas platyrhynchos]
MLPAARGWASRAPPGTPPAVAPGVRPCRAAALVVPRAHRPHTPGWWPCLVLPGWRRCHRAAVLSAPLEAARTLPTACEAQGPGSFGTVVTSWSPRSGARWVLDTGEGRAPSMLRPVGDAAGPGAAAAPRVWFLWASRSASLCPGPSVSSLPLPGVGPVRLGAAGAARGCPGGGGAAGAWREVLGALTPQGLTLATAVRLRPCWNGKLLAAWYKYIWPLPKIPGGSVLPPPAVLLAARRSAALSASSVPLTPPGSRRHRCPKLLALPTPGLCLRSGRAAAHFPFCAFCGLGFPEWPLSHPACGPVVSPRRCPGAALLSSVVSHRSHEGHAGMAPCGALGPGPCQCWGQQEMPGMSPGRGDSSMECGALWVGRCPVPPQRRRADVGSGPARRVLPRCL